MRDESGQRPGGTLLVIYPSNSLSDRSFVGDWEPAARAESVGVEDGTACVPRGRDERSP